LQRTAGWDLRWFNEEYDDRIGLLGGIDVDLPCKNPPEKVFASTVEQGIRYRWNAMGFALRSGNSTPDYVPVEDYLAMIEAAQYSRGTEHASQ
jgi:uroporphyrinogen decarboxylase